MAEIYGIHHLAVRCRGVEQFEEAIKFYTEVLHFPLVRTWMSGDNRCAMVAVGDSLLELFSNGKGDYGTEPFPHLAFKTDDTDTCIETVRAAGYEITMEPTDIIIRSTPPYPARIAFCKGPAGEELEFFCEK